MKPSKTKWSDKELIERCRYEISMLCKTGAKSFNMRVPPDPNHDTDLLLSEIIDRFEQYLFSQGEEFNLMQRRPTITSDRTVATWNGIVGKNEEKGVVSTEEILNSKSRCTITEDAEDIDENYYFKFADAIEAMREYASQFSPQQSIDWAGLEEKYHSQYADGGEKIYSPKVFQWLKEQSAPQRATDTEMIDFAEWIGLEEFEWSSDGEWISQLRKYKKQEWAIADTGDLLQLFRNRDKK